MARISGPDELNLVSTAAMIIANHPTLFLFSTFSVVITSYAFYQRSFSPLSKIPGPFWASMSPLWKLRVFRRGDFHLIILKLHEEYGVTVRIAPNEVIIADGSAIRQIYSTVEGREFLKVSAQV
jgi:hypothetical protein